MVDMKKELDGARKNYDKEKMKNADLQNQLAGLDQDMKFKIQILEAELSEERKRNKIDFNAIDQKLKSDYESRYVEMKKYIQNCFNFHLKTKC